MLIAGFDPTPRADEPQSCAEAASQPSYLGCSFWPTAVANGVLPAFDFAVIVANLGSEPAEVTLTGPSTNQHATVPSGTIRKLYLPWVDALNPPGATCATTPELDASRLGKAAAFHLVSSRPVIASQWNPLQYRAVGLQKPDGEALCVSDCGSLDDCFSVSNDASLLLPDTALTGSYRVTAHARGAGNYLAITATQDQTTVTVTAGGRARILPGEPGTGLVAMAPGESSTFVLDAGDVAELVGDETYDRRVDLSASLVEASAPVQVITGDVCVRSPDKYPFSCDHIEELQLPLAAAGRRYLVTGVTGPAGDVVPHFVRLYGTVNGTALSFDPPLDGAPSALDAGEVVNLGPVEGSFFVAGDAPFLVATFQLSASFVDSQLSPELQRGDPSQSIAIPVEGFRKRHVVIAPDDYESAFVDVALPDGASLTVDGAPSPVAPSPIGTSGFSVVHLPLSTLAGSAHTLVSDQPIGLQVVGYGRFTSYQIPGGTGSWYPIR